MGWLQSNRTSIQEIPPAADTPKTPPVAETISPKYVKTPPAETEKEPPKQDKPK